MWGGQACSGLEQLPSTGPSKCRPIACSVSVRAQVCGIRAFGVARTTSARKLELVGLRLSDIHYVGGVRLVVGWSSCSVARSVPGRAQVCGFRTFGVARTISTRKLELVSPRMSHIRSVEGGSGLVTGCVHRRDSVMYWYAPVGRPVARFRGAQGHVLHEVRTQKGFCFPMCS